MKLRMLHTVCKSYMLTREKLPQEHVLPHGEPASQAEKRARFRLKNPDSILVLTVASQAFADLFPPPPLFVYCFLRRRLE